MKKNPVNKNQGWNPYIKRHNPKKKTKTNNQLKSGNDLLMAMK
jgi:hypothetical protein